MTASVGGWNSGDGVDQALIGEETVERPCRGNIKAAGSKTGGGGGTWEPIPTKEVDDTLLCRAVNGDRVRVKSMFTLVGGPPLLRASDGLATFWAYHSQGGVQFKLRPQVGTLSLRGGGPSTSAGIRRVDLGETMTGRGRSAIG